MYRLGSLVTSFLASATYGFENTLKDMADAGIDMKMLEQLEGMDLSQLMGNAGGPDLDSVESDLRFGYVQDNAKLDPVSINIDAMADFDDNQQKYTFQAETSRLMDIIVNSLYSNREVFLRELISNASDALSKLKHKQLSEGTQMDDQLAIYIEANKQDHTLTIFDNGIGMNEKELVENLGTIARSGSHAFLEQLAEGGDINVIGQFGVGFYSAFLVADDVFVHSHQEGHDEYVWRSQASDGFTIHKVDDTDVDQGTRVTLKLKQDAYKYSNPDTVERLIREHSEFIDFPVFLKKKDQWVHVNPVKPIWLRPKNEVTEEEYIKFYRKLSKDFREPLKTIHYNGEGEVEFKSVLYIPDNKDPSLFGDPSASNQNKINLYSRGVVISQEREILPQYLGFIYGVVESNDLPLKVDREQLSNSKEMKLINKRLTKKVIDTLAHTVKDPESWSKIWANYKTNLFLGCLVEDNSSVKNKIANMFRFEHLLSGNPKDTIRLAEFPSNPDTDEGSQDPIFYMWANSSEEARTAPILELFKKQGQDVLLVQGTIADQCLEALGTFDGRPFVSVERGNVDQYLKLEVDDEESMARSRMMASFLSDMKSAIHGAGYQTFDDVDITYKLVDSPSAIFASGTGVTAAQEKHIRNQSWFDENEMGWRLGKKVLSVNPHHPIVKSLFHEYSKSGPNERVTRGARMLYDFALLSGGHHLEMPELISHLLKDSMSRDLEVSEPTNYKPLDIPAEYYQDEEEDDDKNIEMKPNDEEPKTDSKQSDESGDHKDEL